MAFVVNDRVQETTTTTGTGTINLNGAVTGFESFVSAIGNGNVTYYAIVGGSEFEVGIGTVTDAATDTLSRTTVISSSNSDALVNFSAGTKSVFCTLPASKAALVNTSNNVIVGNSNTDTAITTRGTGDITVSTNEGTNSGTVKIFDGVNGNIEITPNGTGVVKLDGLSYPIADGTAGQFLKTNGSATLSFSTAGFPNVTTFTTGTSVTFTTPSTANWIQINLWGGGGSGGNSSAGGAGGGGGGGGFNSLTIPFSYLVSTVVYSVGAGGTAASVTNTNGNQGGQTSVILNNYNNTGLNKTISAYGGGAGSTNGTANGGAGGGGGIFAAGGNSSAGTQGAGGGPSLSTLTGGSFGGASGAASAADKGGSSYYGGGGGARGDSSAASPGAGGDSIYGGAGGGGASDTGTGSVGGESIYGGNGGNGGSNGGAPTAGLTPGGGGGGSEARASGAGGEGTVQFIYW